VAAAIARALNMPLAERRERHAAILTTLARNGSTVWSTHFLESLGAAQLLQPPQSDRTVAEPPLALAKTASRH
jgi:trehalose-6-phosphate synthase